jgi:putative SOS response-associated peptidase YedK
MCNDYRLLTNAAELFEGFSETRIKIRFSEGAPNIEAREDIKITDTAPIVRASNDGAETSDLVQRRWSWPGQGRKPVYNFRSDDREFASGRCLIPADGFYEFTYPADKKKKRKDKWLFTKTGEPWFCVAGMADRRPSRRGLHNVDDAAWARHRALPRPADRHTRSRRLGCLARYVGFSEGDPEAASCGQPRRRTGGLNAPVTPFGVSAHEQKNEPAGGSREYDRHFSFLLNSVAWSASEGRIRSVTSARRF